MSIAHDTLPSDCAGFLTLRCTGSATAGFARFRTRVNSNVSCLEVTVTFILNVLHRDISIIAADSKAIAGGLNLAAPEMSAPAEVGSVVNDFSKITLNPSLGLAIGIAGNTHEHFYLPEIRLSANISEVLSKIRKHMEYFLRVNDRTLLKSLPPFMVNQSIVTFFDKEADIYCTNTFLFSPVENQTRLHSGGNVAKVFHAGSGSQHFEKAVGLETVSYTHLRAHET